MLLPNDIYKTSSDDEHYCLVGSVLNDLSKDKDFIKKFKVIDFFIQTEICIFVIKINH